MLREEGVPLWTCPLANHHLGDTQGSTDPSTGDAKCPVPPCSDLTPHHTQTSEPADPRAQGGAEPCCRAGRCSLPLTGMSCRASAPGEGCSAGWGPACHRPHAQGHACPGAGRAQQGMDGAGGSAGMAGSAHITSGVKHPPCLPLQAGCWGLKLGL